MEKKVKVYDDNLQLLGVQALSESGGGSTELPFVFLKNGEDIIVEQDSCGATYEASITRSNIQKIYANIDKPHFVYVRSHRQDVGPINTSLWMVYSILSSANYMILIRVSFPMTDDIDQAQNSIDVTIID